MTRLTPEQWEAVCARQGVDPATGRRRAAATETPRAHREAAPLEREVHAEVARLLDALDLLWHSGEATRAASQREGAIRHAQGKRAGWPDIVIVTPPATWHRAVAIELKRPGGGRVSDHQRRWLRGLHEAGWLVAICRSGEEVRAVLAVAYPKLVPDPGNAADITARCQAEATR